MAKIVLCGTPLSGKSELAIELERAMRKHGLHPTAIIDNYTKEIQGRLDLGVGPQGSYLVDLAVAIERLGQEFYEGRNGAEHFIVCGSLVETAIHTAINCQVDQSDVSWAVANVVMPLYPLMRRSSGIHTTYLLPPPEEPSKFELAMWENYPLTFEALGVKYEELPAEFRNLWVDFILKDTFDIENTNQD